MYSQQTLSREINLKNRIDRIGRIDRHVHFRLHNSTVEIVSASPVIKRL